jgi:hypothetical protein
MNRMTLFALTVAAGFVGAACEQHPASELEGEGLSFTRPEAPKAPTNEATNPGGAAPVQPANDKGALPAGRPTESPSFFPAK